MKANELMLGDWVQGFIPDTYSKVVGILNEYRLAIIGGGAYMELSIDDVQPIPLTPEILEKNGFSKSRLMGEQRHFTYYLGAGLELCAIYDADFSFPIGDGARKIRYVHELQHALRLCGIKKTITI